MYQEVLTQNENEEQLYVVIQTNLHQQLDTHGIQLILKQVYKSKIKQKFKAYRLSEAQTVVLPRTDQAPKLQNNQFISIMTKQRPVDIILKYQLTKIQLQLLNKQRENETGVSKKISRNKRKSKTTKYKINNKQDKKTSNKSSPNQRKRYNQQNRLSQESSPKIEQVCERLSINSNDQRIKWSKDHQIFMNSFNKRLSKTVMSLRYKQEHVLSRFKSLSPIQQNQNIKTSEECKDSISKSIDQQQKRQSNQIVSLSSLSSQQRNINNQFNQSTKCTIDSQSDSQNEIPRISKVLQVNNIKDKDITAKMIYNIFSNYGNIQRLILYPLEEFARIQFSKKKKAQIAKKNLDGVPLFTHPIKIKYEQQDVIQSKEFKQAKLGFNGELTFKGTKSSFRYKKFKKKMVANPPSRTLQISNLSIESCTVKRLVDLFSKHGSIQNLKLLFHSENRNMALIQFNSIIESLRIIAFFQNEKFYKRRMQISFTKSTI